MKLQEVLDRTTKFFREKQIDTPRLDAELILAKTLGLRRIDLYLKFDQPLAETELSLCRSAVARRAAGEPVAYILGEKDFFGRSFKVDSNVLIPRPETELLVEAALQHLKKHQIESPKILDLGTGSGCIGLSIAASYPSAEVTLVDLSKEALQVAKGNAERLALLDRCQSLHSNVGDLKLAPGSFDVILANPPYIASGDARVQVEVKEFEPHLALFASGGGLALFKEWSSAAVVWLKPRAFIGFEFGIDQAVAVMQHFQGFGLDKVHILDDFSYIPRHIIGERGFSNG